MNGKKAKIIRRMASSMGSALGKQGRAPFHEVVKITHRIYRDLKRRYKRGELSHV